MRPPKFEAAMDFLGDPEATVIRRYVTQLEDRDQQSTATLQAQRRKIEALERSHRRYEYLRTLNVPQFQALYVDNIRKGRHFDDLVDEAIAYMSDLYTHWRPTMSRNLPQFKCHKIVGAVKIKAVEPTPVDKATVETAFTIVPEEPPGFTPFTVSQEYVDKFKPQPGGYFVEYADGYESFSPAQAFEEGYTRI